MPTLRRALGRWDLTAIGVNQVIGGAIFLVPSQVAAQIGGWSPVGFLLTGIAMLAVALCFAEVGSRFDRTGGPYVYTRAAFGRFVGFEVGWLQWFTRAASQASVMAGIAVALGYYWPAMTGGWPRAALLLTITAALAWVNVRGIRQSAWVVNTLTIGKLLPLAVFIAVGLFYIEPARLTAFPPVSMNQVSTAALLLIFIYGGFDVVGTPAGESLDPRRHVPFALVTTILAVTAIMTLDADRRAGRAARSGPAQHADCGRGGRVPRRLGCAARRRRIGDLDDRQQRRSGAERLAHAVRAGGARRAAGVLRPHSSALPHAGQRRPVHVGRGCAACLVRIVDEACGRQRRDPAGDVCGRQRGDPPSAVADICRTRAGRRIRGAARPGRAPDRDRDVLAVFVGATREQFLGGFAALAAGAAMFAIRTRVRD